ADSYEIELDGTILDNGSNTVYEYAGLMSNTSHTYRIRAINETGFGDWSELKTKYTSPDVPGNISAVSTGNSITLTWDAVESASGYDVEVLGSPVDNGNSTTFIHRDLDPNMQRTYRVRAKNGNGFGDWSEVVAAATLTGVPVNMRTDPTDTAIRFIWDPSAGAAAYDVEADDAIIEDITTTEYGLSGLRPNSLHTFRVRSQNSMGASEWSEVITASTLPAVPKFILAESSYDSVRTVWESVYGQESYEIEIDGAVIDCGTSSEYIHQGLQPNTSHTYRVRAKNEYVTGNWSGLVIKWTLPDAPKNLSAAAASNSINLTWDNINGAVGYDIEADGIIVSLGIDTSYLHGDLSSNTEHVYRVRARNEAGAGKWSAEAKAFTLLGVPQNIRTFSGSSSIRMVWNEVYGVTGYEIEADGSLIEIGQDTEYIHSGLMPNTTHIYRIRAKAGEAAGDWSERVTADTLLASIADIKAVSSNTSISLSWTPVGDAESYDLEADGSVIAGIPEPAYIIEGLLPNTPHSFRVMAKSETNISDWSGSITKYTTPDIPGNVTLFSTTSSITLTWEAVYGAAGYDVEAEGAIIDNGTNASYVHEGLSSNTQHSYRLRSRNEHEVSQWSAEIIGTTEPELIFSIAEDNLFNFVIAAPKVEGAAGRTITVTYDPEEVEAVDLCAATSKADIEAGDIPGTNLEVMEFTPGKIVFSLKDPGRTIMNAVIFKAKINGQSKILYVIE
ncbi:MAG: fibronectin type III domain-containing protein, partial [Erysipelotrichales bacterium]|nr:fibronectin type III domain-containing protein [Erysipelotrichales bacterium]